MSRTEAEILTNGVPSSPGEAIPTMAIQNTASGVVHDLGNLVQVAASALNVISRSPFMESDPGLPSVVASARISLQRAGTLIRQTLLLAHEGGTSVEAVSVTACLLELQALIENTWEPGIRCDLQIGRQQLIVECNQVHLQSAILNLLINARDAMPNGGTISLLARIVQEVDGRPEIEVRVADNGIGMGPDTMQRAFEPFFTTRVTGLGGLGLPMVKRFAQETGGSVGIESEPGVGTVVTLCLPMAEEGGDRAGIGRDSWGAPACQTGGECQNSGCRRCDQEQEASL